jgi:type IV fimbrial biogenesis protein FimT
LARAARARRARRGSAQAGFSLMELMIVVILISILAMLAIPTMGAARFDRLAFSEASNITELMRAARTRSLARGSAVLVRLSADTVPSTAPAQRGRFEMWESVAPNVSGSGWNRTPRSSCKSPAVWTLDPAIPPPAGANAAFLDAVDLNGTYDAQAAVQAQVIDPVTSNAVADIFLCYTPLGRVYYSVANAGLPNFDLATPLTGVTQVRVYRYDSSQAVDAYSGIKKRGPLRVVTLPGAGMARLVSR